MPTLVEQLISSWEDRIERDLQPFADPGSSVDVQTVGRTLNASWQQRAVSRTLTLSGIVQGNVRVTADGRTDTYQGFFAGPTMGDLTGLAKMMLQAQPRSRLYVRTRARMLESATQVELDAVDLIRQETQRSDDDTRTLLLVVTGEPGAGKTRALQEIVRATAIDYVKGQSTSLFLYINAQGRALARFNEALATELQDLRSLLTYHAVSTLVRLGLVIPIVDGFDELLGTGGYEDAFSSLSSFLEELDGMGAMVASARSTYYEHEFVLRANRISSLGSHAWTQRPIEICAWSDKEFDAYIEAACSNLDQDSHQKTAEKIRHLFKSHPDLKTKPFFVVRVTELVLEGKVFDTHGSLLERLVSAYLVREQSEKLLDRSGKPLVDMNQLKNLYVELAEEMWNQETRQLDARSVRELAEMALLTDALSGGGSQVIVERMPTMAFLSTGSKRGSVAFEHESFFNFFLGLRLTEKLAGNSSALERFLGRAVVPEEVASQSVGSFVNASEDELQRIFDHLSSATQKSSLNRQTVRESGGVVVLELLKSRTLTSNLRISNVDIPGGTLNGCQLSNVSFNGVEFKRVDFGNAVLVKCPCTQTVFLEISIDVDSSHLDFDQTVGLADFRGLRIYSREGLNITYEPREIQKALVAVGALTFQEPTRVREVSDEVLKLLDILARGYLRSNPLTTEDNKLINLKRSALWPELENLLVKYGIVAREQRETKGAKKGFLRRQIDIWQVLEGRLISEATDPNVSAFWEELELRFPAV